MGIFSIISQKYSLYWDIIEFFRNFLDFGSIVGQNEPKNSKIDINTTK